MSSRSLSSVLRSRPSIFKPRQPQPQPLQRLSCPSLGQTRSYAPNHDDPSSTTTPSQNDLLNTKLLTLLNAIPPSQKIRYIKDNSTSPSTHPTPPPALLAALLNFPSPLPYTIGTDICHIPRIRLLLERQLAESGYVEPDMPRFWTRVLTPLEARYSGWKAGGGVEGSARFLAGRWAAKEAVVKAVGAAYPGGAGKVFMHDIVILNAKTQSALLEARKAAVRIEARDARTQEEQMSGGGGREGGWVEVSVSISHDGEYATATALVSVDPKIAGVKREKSLVRGVVAKTYTDARYL
ncbi:hypothetical protein VC83_00471 [Pseudogymnoascus destructans]|uniref:4'-phosphopantetheinyl transferase domain-containing protein n=1 Tax=Pseudogymnoascus destructans TaxID=655981 RepID=A0A177APW5_9PEZI|nr:uncharacterized protein VC83_00471 [Pseudogymnoascus destructans]OAF63264.1 hypothetical protein VC83_00471 [Pseudogymnoascus destructans]